jgi:hypothetical protein
VATERTRYVCAPSAQTRRPDPLFARRFVLAKLWPATEAVRIRGNERNLSVCANTAGFLLRKLSAVGSTDCLEAISHYDYAFHRRSKIFSLVFLAAIQGLGSLRKSLGLWLKFGSASIDTTERSVAAVAISRSTLSSSFSSYWSFSVPLPPARGPPGPWRLNGESASLCPACRLMQLNQAVEAHAHSGAQLPETPKSTPAPSAALLPGMPGNIAKGFDLSSWQSHATGAATVSSTRKSEDRMDEETKQEIRRVVEETTARVFKETIPRVVEESVKQLLLAKKHESKEGGKEPCNADGNQNEVKELEIECYPLPELARVLRGLTPRELIGSIRDTSDTLPILEAVMKASAMCSKMTPNQVARIAMAVVQALLKLGRDSQRWGDPVKGNGKVLGLPTRRINELDDKVVN